MQPVKFEISVMLGADGKADADMSCRNPPAMSPSEIGLCFGIAASTIARAFKEVIATLPPEVMVEAITSYADAALQTGGDLGEGSVIAAQEVPADYNDREGK